MAVLGRGVTYLRLLRSSARVLFTCKNPAVHKLGKWTNVLYASVASLTLGAGLCAIPFKQVENLSHDALIRRAASLVTDSSSTFLSQTTLALIDAITEYSKAVHTLVALQSRYLDALGKLSPAEEDSIWQVIINQRAQVNDRQDECQRLESTWVTAVKLCETAAEAAYTSGLLRALLNHNKCEAVTHPLKSFLRRGAEHASVTARTNVHLAQSQVEDVQKLSADADKKLAESKVMEVERMALHAAALQSNVDEEEVPEAYLRED